MPKPTLAPVSGSNPIQHVVIIVQENRTPDNLFHGLKGADIANSGLDRSGHVIPLRPIPLDAPYDINHSHTSFLEMYDGGKMDGAGTNHVSCESKCTYANPQYGYVPSSENAPYMQMAPQYTFADRMFQTNEGPSYPAHQFIFSGTSEPETGSSLLVAENPGANAHSGCLADELAPVRVIDPAGNENETVPSCFDHETLADLLDAKAVSWRYYASTTDGIWVAPNSIRHLRAADFVDVITPQTQVLEDVTEGKLAQVSWVTPAAGAVRSCLHQQWHRSRLGGVRRQRDREEPILEQYRHLRHLGRLGWLVRPREAGSRRILRTRIPFPSSSFRRLPKRIRFAHAARVRQHLEIHRKDFDLAASDSPTPRSDDLSDCFNPVPNPEPLSSDRSGTLGRLLRTAAARHARSRSGLARRFARRPYALRA